MIQAFGGLWPKYTKGPSASVQVVIRALRVRIVANRWFAENLIPTHLLTDKEFWAAIWTFEGLVCLFVFGTNFTASRIELSDAGAKRDTAQNLSALTIQNENSVEVRQPGPRNDNDVDLSGNGM